MTRKCLFGRWRDPGRGCVGDMSFPGTNPAPPTTVALPARSAVGGWGRTRDGRTRSDQPERRFVHSPQDLLPRLVLIHLEELK